MFKFRPAFGVWLVVPVCVIMFSAKFAGAGTERISLTLGVHAKRGANDTVPVYVQLSNGVPDYIDMTYLAQD